MKYEYFSALESCHAYLISYYKSMKQSMCLNYDICKMPPKVDRACIVTNSVFNSKCVNIGGGRSATVHVLLRSKWKREAHGCSKGHSQALINFNANDEEL